MADTHILSEKIPQESPEWFRSWVTERNDYLQKLTRNMFGRLQIGENVSAKFITRRVLNGQTLSLPHGLDRIVRTSLIANGRVRFFKVESRTSRDVQVKCTLASTSILVQQPTLKKDRFSVADSTIFEIGDSVRVAGIAAVIKGIAGNELRLDRKVFTPLGSEVILDAEEVTFLVM